ncbi:mirror-image polydactyly gene 1 protein isoform X4 [Mastacembelus armatus]|nr:mirror-image polydactyly gene 1 protein isoform X4 [Mastacembelus armatus]XP_026164155.1 mirror-image polydactyly gene 1 protein isoform X4 [Mastacembelus armatus]
METHLSASRGPSPQAQSSGDAPEGRGASRGPGSPALRRHLVTNASSFHQDVFGQVQDLDRDKNISFLLKQLDALREVNTKLQDQLLQKEKELQRREVEEELREEQREARGWQRPAVVLEEVLAAQKDRDQAVMSRLLLANEERDEAVLRARRLQQAAAYVRTENLNLEDSDMDVSDLLQRVCDADSVQEVEQFGSVLVQRLRLARQRRDDITAQEMKAVMEERDGSVAKCKRLEQDLLQEREQRPAKEEILRLQRERDRALEDQQQLEVELQVLRSNHRSQGLLTPPASSSQGVSLPHQTPPLLTHLEQSTPLQTPPLQVQLHQLSKEREIMKAELRRCREAEQEASERIHRLERLVEVLRKKVGTGNLRAVI